MATSRLDILINAKNKASPQIKNVSKDVGGLSKAATGAIAAISAMGVAFAALKLGNVAIELAKGADAAARVEDSYRKLATEAGTSADNVLTAMKEMSKGTISETDLMLSANRAMMLGVAASANEMSGLLEVAIERGAALGLSSQQAFNDLVTGIGRMSPQILDNLGIVINAETAYNAYAISIGKASDSLSEAEQKQAILNAVLAEADGVLDTTVSSFENVAASIANAKDALGELFAPVVISGAEALAETIDGINADLAGFEAVGATRQSNVLARSIEQLKDTYADLDAELQGVYPSSLAYTNIQSEMAGVQAQINTLSEEYFGVISKIPASQNAMASALDATVINAEMTTRSIQSLTTATIQFMNASSAITLDIGEAFDPALEQADATIQRMGSSLYDVLGPSGIQGFIDDGSASVRAQKEAWEALGYEPKFINDVLMPGYLSHLDDGIRKTSTLGGATAKVSEQYSKLKSTVESVLSGAIGPVAGVNAEDFLPREDEINENARRLADIMVNGLIGQDWLGEFAAEAPDVYEALMSAGDPQTAAASLLKDFQDGLRPDLIDKEVAKERVKRMILGEENTAALAQEIAAELSSELGVSLQQAQLAASSVLGTGGGEDNAAIPDTLKKSEGRIGKTGEDAGKVWGAGFLSTISDNVPMELISILVTLTTPGIYALINAGSSRTEAE